MTQRFVSAQLPAVSMGARGDWTPGFADRLNAMLAQGWQVVPGTITAVGDQVVVLVQHENPPPEELPFGIVVRGEPFARPNHPSS